MKHRTTARANRGFTLVELCVGVGICSAVLAQALPSLAQFRQQQQLRVTANSVADDLRFARSEAARSGDSVFFRISGKGKQACYVMHTGAKGDCDCSGGQAICRGASSQVIKAAWLPASQGLSLKSNSESLEFQHRQGLVTPTGYVEVAMAGGSAIRHIVAITGRVRSCYAATKISGLAKCA